MATSVLSHKAAGRRWKTVGAEIQVRFAKLIVSAYKIAGLIILTAILATLASYMFLVVFYTFSTRWIAPQIISPADERVLRLSNELVQSTLLQEKLLADRSDMKARLNDAQRIVTAGRNYQQALTLAVHASYMDRQGELTNIEQLTKNFKSRRADSAAADRKYIASSRDELQAMHKAHLIDENAYMAGEYQLSEFETANLAMQKNTTELENKQSDLRREVEALGVVNATISKGGAVTHELSSDALHAKRDFDAVSVDVRKAIDTQESLRGQLASLEGAIKRQDVISGAIANSAYIRAAQDNLTVAFVPYTNTHHASPGQPIYGCSFRLLWCKRVGRVTNALQGEVVEKHPFRNKEVRGILVQMDVEDPRWVHNDLLFVGKPPLWLPW